MFESLWKKVEESSEKKLPRTITEISEEYDDLILEYSIVPDEAVEFLIGIFSNDKILHAKGIEHFLLEINVDLQKYTLEQRGKLLGTLTRSSHKIFNELSRHSVGDFIARAFPAETAFEEFIKLSKGNSFERHVAFVGLDVLRRRQPKESDLYKNIEVKWREILSNGS